MTRGRAGRDALMLLPGNPKLSSVAISFQLSVFSYQPSALYCLFPHFCVLTFEFFILFSTSEKPIPKNLMMKCMKELAKIRVRAPIKCGDIVCENILNTGVNTIASRDLPEER